VELELKGLLLHLAGSAAAFVIVFVLLMWWVLR
jgi:hypothetical protein